MRKTEFLIVGNGLAGTLLAFEMLKENQDFLIIASPKIKRASEIAAGMFNPLVFKRLTKSWMADELLPVAKDSFQKLEQLLGEQFYFEKKILKPLSTQEKELWLERKQNLQFRRYISSVDNFSPVKNVMPAAGFAQVSGSGYVALSAFLKLADNYFKLNKRIIDTTFDVQKMNPEATSFELDGVKASKVIFCEGAHITHNPLFQWVKMVPVKGELIQIHSPQLSEKYILNKKVFVLPTGNHRFKVGSTYDWKDLSNRPTETGKLTILEKLENLISADFQLEQHWAGIRPATSDRRPVLGIHPQYRNISVFNGLGTKGVMLAPFFAKEVLKLLTEKEFSVNREVDLRRFLN